MQRTGGRNPVSRRALAVAAALLAAAGGAAAADVQRNVIAPYRFEPAPVNRPSGLDEEKARGYREELRGQLREQETKRIDRDALGARDLMDTRRELNRMDRVLNAPPRPAPPPAPAVGTLSAEDRATYERSGGHSQPTPEEIKQRQAERKTKEEPALPELRPVYDLFGNRIQ
jgi:hypothetical protein